MIEINKVYLGDCLEIMKSINDRSIDMILCDLPYGTTAYKWDKIIPFKPLWEQYLRIIKDRSAIVLTSSQPFTSLLISSNLKYFKYEWIWNKLASFGFQTARIKPLKQHENILVFSKSCCVTCSKSNMVYYSQNLVKQNVNRIINMVPGTLKNRIDYIGINYNSEYSNYPKSILNFSNADHTNIIHPTQKPVPLFEYLIKTYTKENEIVLDNCIGNGTTAIACINTNRKYIGIEKDEEIFNSCNKRINDYKRLLVDKQKFEVYK
jgi:site-specific DNA-methyltransferase (adenine-specific)